MELPEVAGRRMLMTHAQFERGCKLRLKEEQEKPSPDTHLVNLLCEAVRLSREHTDWATRPIGDEGASKPYGYLEVNLSTGEFRHLGPDGETL